MEPQSLGNGPSTSNSRWPDSLSSIAASWLLLILFDLYYQSHMPLPQKKNKSSCGCYSAICTGLSCDAFPRRTIRTSASFCSRARLVLKSLNDGFFMHASGSGFLRGLPLSEAMKNQPCTLRPRSHISYQYPLDYKNLKRYGGP